MPRSAWRRPGAFHERGFHPTAICGIFGGDGGRRRGSAGSTPRRRRARSASPARIASRPLRLPRRRRRATKPIHPAWAAHGAHPRGAARGARRRGPAGGARGPLRPLPRLRRRDDGRDRHRRPARRPRRALGDAADRVQAVSRRATSCTARSARPPSAARATLDPDEIEDVVVTVPEAGVSLVLEPADAEDRAAHGVRGQVLASSTRPRRCSCTAASASPTYTDEAIADPARARRSRARCATRRRTTRPTRQAFPGGVADHAARRRRRSRPTSRTSAAGPRTR